jgi:hypothetical protein
VILANACNKGGELCNFLKLVSLLVVQEQNNLLRTYLYNNLKKLTVKIESGPKQIASDRQYTIKDQGSCRRNAIGVYKKKISCAEFCHHC